MGKRFKCIRFNNNMNSNKKNHTQALKFMVSYFELPGNVRAIINKNLGVTDRSIVKYLNNLGEDI
jgi:hypothetical protein